MFVGGLSDDHRRLFARLAAGRVGDMALKDSAILVVNDEFFVGPEDDLFIGLIADGYFDAAMDKNGFSRFVGWIRFYIETCPENPDIDALRVDDKGFAGIAGRRRRRPRDEVNLTTGLAIIATPKSLLL